MTIKFYTILSEGRDEPLNKNSTLAEIKKAYRALIQDSHPDKGGDLNKCQILNEAYEILCDPVKRREHDSTLLDEDVFLEFDPVRAFTVFLAAALQIIANLELKKEEERL